MLKDKKEPEIYLHVGLHKTSTTFLQKEIFPKLESVNLQVHPYSIFDMYIDKKKKNILSGEAFSLSMPHYDKSHYKTNRQNALEYLKRLFPDAKIIIGVREKDSWLKSCYSQYIIQGGIFSFEDYLKKYENNIIDINQYLEQLHEFWNDIFVYDFKDLKSNTDQVISDLCSFMYCPVPRYEKKKRNESLNKNQIRILRKINKICSLSHIIPIDKIIRKILQVVRGNSKLNNKNSKNTGGIKVK